MQLHAMAVRNVVVLAALFVGLFNLPRPSNGSFDGQPLDGKYRNMDSVGVLQTLRLGSLTHSLSILVIITAT